MKDALSLEEAAERLGPDVSIGNIQGRIRRGSLAAHQDENGKWQIPVSEIQRVLDDAPACSSCSRPSRQYVIVKYHHHDRVEFTLCERCAETAQSGYSRRGGVLEVVAYPFHGEGWLQNPK